MIFYYCLLLLPKSNVGEEKSDKLNRHSAMFSSRSMESAAELKGLWMGANQHDCFFFLVSFGLSFFSFFCFLLLYFIRIRRIMEI